MKYLVNVSYTNPAHEHVSLRRRVDTINRVVEARSEEEALNRVANQQRALGFLVRDAKVIEEAVSFGRSGGVMHYDSKTEKSEKPAKGVSALDKDGNLVGHYPDLETAKKLKPGHTYQTSKGVAKEEVESVEEGLLDKAKTVAKNISGIVNPKTPEEKAKSIQRSAQASFYTSRLKRDDANRKAAGMKPLSGIDRLKTKADGLKRAAEPYVKAALKGVNEEVEQVEEGAKETAMRAFDLADKMRKKNPAQAKIYQKLGQKASLRMNNPTGVSAGKPSGSGNKAQRRMGVEPVPSAMSSDRMRGYFEEVEQTDEALLPKQQAVADKLKASELAANKEKAGYKFGKGLRAAKVAAKMKVNEVVDEKEPTKGKKAASKMTQKAAELRKDKIKGSANKVNMKPEVDLTLKGM